MNHRSRGAAAALALVALAAGLSGCSSDDSDEAVGTSSPPSASPTPAPPGPDDIQYVALGDSYASAPGVPTTDQAGGCFRSDSNYAHVLAESADLYLTDVTCSGATSDQIIAEQVPAISPDTDVVTVGTGGNDLDLFVRVLQSCLDRPDSGLPATACSDVVLGEIEPEAAQIQDKMGAVLDAITEAAPDAEVYVVGYPVLLPDEGTCPDIVPIAPENYPLVGGLTRALSEGLRLEAEERGLSYVDVFAASQGHDICSDEPWVNGAQVGADGTAPLHPFARGQAAVAALVEDML